MMEGILNGVQLDANSLLHIFSFLDNKEKQNVAQVCRYWKDIVYLPCLWRNARIILHHSLDDLLIRSFQQRKITRFVCRGSKDEDLALLFATIPDITRLDIDQCRHVTQQFLQENLNTLNKLESLHITRCIQVSVESLYQERSFSDVLSRLKSFTLPEDINSDSLQNLIRKCPSLEEIDYASQHLFNFIEKYPNLLAKSCAKLQRLRLLGDSWEPNINAWKTFLLTIDLKAIDFDGWLGVGEYVKLVADILPNLETLNIVSRMCSFRVIDALTYAVKKLKNLKHLTFPSWYLSTRSARQTTDERGLFHELSQLTQLESLKIDIEHDIFSGETIYSLTENMPNLKSLTIGQVANISAEYADLIGDRLTKLRSMNITAKQNATGIGALCSKLSNLEDLVIHHDNLLNRDLKEMTTCLLTSKLKSLNIAGSKKINDLGLTCIVNSLKSLTSLDITKCSVSDVGVSVIVENLSHLQSLSVTGRKVTNQGAIMIGKHLKGLEQLKIHGTKIGDQGFAFICNHLPKLHTLKAFCKWVTDQGYLEGAVSLGKLTTLQIGSHRISYQALQESLKHLQSVVHLTIRSIILSPTCMESIIKELPCLSNFCYHRCSHNLSHEITTYMTICTENGIEFDIRFLACEDRNAIRKARQIRAGHWPNVTPSRSLSHSPSRSPSRSPSYSPSRSPSRSPSHSPSRSPSPH